jgi:hypothetical protein
MTRITRAQKNTVFGFGEGESERVFLKHLRSLYAGNKTSVRVDAAGGKDPSHILEKAVRVRSNIPYNHSFALLDTDREWSQSLRNKAKTKRIELIGSSPCIEGMLLSILELRANPQNRSSNDCKRHFQEAYLRVGRTITDTDCKRLFPKTTLDQVIVNIQPLKRLIEIMEGKF